MDGSVEPNLFIVDYLKHFSVETFLKIINLIKEKSIDTIFIDDIEEFVGNEFTFETVFEERNDSVLDSFLFLLNNYSVRVIFNTTLRKVYGCSGGQNPTLPDFSWNRRMITTCSQMYIVYRSLFHGYAENESGSSTKNDIEIVSVKNENCRDEIFKLDNEELKIYP